MACIAFPSSCGCWSFYRNRTPSYLIEAGALEYFDHPGGATGMLVKDYRGRNAEQEIY
jgi:hypothetical protein